VKEAGAEERVKFLDYVNINELAQLYRNATVFVYPSIYEAFGMPILEAFSSGCPVIG
jgi:glycosyltransferase involved in cell wall biosynthesis